MINIAVTGASGFIGMELLAVLNKRDDVTVTALTRDASSHSDSARCLWKSSDYSLESLTGIFTDAHTDAVIHLAGVRGTENDPEKFSVNKSMTENILNAMTVSGVRRIVFASTVSVYDDESLIPWTEDAPLRGRSMYGDSKADCEELIKNRAGGSGTVTYGIARIAQVLGEGEKRRGMMNVFIDTAADHGTLKVMGRSLAKKQYIYVKDLVNVLTILACGSSCLGADENIIVNVGMPNAYTNLEIAGIVNKVFENPAPVDYDDSYPETGRPFFMDISRLKDKLAYEPLDMEEALTQMKRDR